MKLEKMYFATFTCTNKFQQKLSAFSNEFWFDTSYEGLIVFSLYEFRFFFFVILTLARFS